MRVEGNAFVVGANLPWIDYGGDVGANAWSPEGGLGRPDRAARLDEVLGRAVDHGIDTVRWFLLCDGRAGIDSDDRGRPLGLDRFVRRDLDVALRALDRAGLRALFVLFDFLLVHRRRQHAGVEMFGRRAWVREADARARLMEHVVAPLVAHAGDAVAVAGWDLMNEPEWVTFGTGGWLPWRCVSRATMRGFLADARDAVRQRSRRPVTVGLASLRGLDLVRGLGLDLYQVHWYDHVEPPWALVTPAASHALDAPLWLGEFPTATSSQSPVGIVSAARHAGYAGAFGWSLCADDRFSSAAGCFEAARYCRRSNSDPAIGNPHTVPR